MKSPTEGTWGACACRCPPFSVVLADTSPGIFTANQTGRGQAAILNASGIPNSNDIPARKGSPIQIFATGAGTWVFPLAPAMQPQHLVDGSVYLGSWMFLVRRRRCR
jgi:uncharacterized protein (TIGR03437 family)